jgi:outer membrane biosynthesis protein TonB
LSESIHKSVLALEARTAVTPGIALAVVLHAAVFGAALYLPLLFDRPPPLRKPSLSPGPASVPKQREPSRRELMERALARAAGKATTEQRKEPDPERAGSAQGSPEGTATSAEEGDAYFTAVHDAILENYVVPSVISERERLYLSATVVAYIGPAGQILKHEFQKKSGNHFFDEALELAIQRSKLPPPPADLAASLRNSGVVLNFRP